MYRRYLAHLKTWNEEFEADLEKAIGEEITEAVRQAEVNPPPPVETLFEDVYSEMPPHLGEQLADLKSTRRR